MGSEQKGTILIVDDEQLVIQALVEILSPEYAVFIAKDGQEAVRQAKRLIPDVILLDIVMPDIDGYDVLAILKSAEETKDIPVIFITGIGEISAEKKALAMGAADYITKPFNSGIVLLRVQNQIKIIERYKIESDLNVVLKLQEELVAAKEQAEHSSRVKSEFLSRMSHEMLTPMNAIEGMLRLIQLRPEKAKGYLDEIEKATKSLNGMINDVLDISGMEYGITELEETEFSFRDMLDNVIKEAAGYSDTKQQKVTSGIDESVPEELIGDIKRLSQLIGNLLANAIKFTPDNGEIHISAQLKDDIGDDCIIQVEVADNGVGILKEQQKNLFEIFEQVDGSNSRKHGGIGIGLALSKRYVEMMDGEIWVESELGKGAKFFFTCKLRKVV